MIDEPNFGPVLWRPGGAMWNLASVYTEDSYTTQSLIDFVVTFKEVVLRGVVTSIADDLDNPRTVGQSE